MAKTKEKPKKQIVSDTTAIQLNVPNRLYYAIKHRADKDTVKDGQKKTIHDRMIEDLEAQNK